jgi:hypothetical protein
MESALYTSGAEMQCNGEKRMTEVLMKISIKIHM